MTVSTNTAMPPAPAGASGRTSNRFRSNIQTYTIIIALIAIWALFAILTKGSFLSAQNISNLFRQMTVTALLAIGMVFVIVTGNIDLSVGKLAGFVSVIAAYLQASFWYKYIPDQPLLAASLSVLVGVVAGIFFGMITGWIVAFLGVPSFITTLGGQFIFSGLILLVTQGKTIPANQKYFDQIAQGYFPAYVGWVIAAVVIILLFWNMFRSRASKVRHGFEVQSMAYDVAITTIYSLLIVAYVYIVNQYKGVQAPVLLLAAAALIMTYVGNNTRFGRYTYAIGGNREASRLSGINIRRVIFLVFVLMGLLAGIAGVVLASYVGYGTIAAGQSYELDAIASAILGGTSTLGGVGTVPGALVGALIMSSINTGLQMLNVAPAWQYVVKGTVLIVAVYADVRFKNTH